MKTNKSKTSKGKSCLLLFDHLGDGGDLPPPPPRLCWCCPIPLFFPYLKYMHTEDLGDGGVIIYTTLVVFLLLVYGVHAPYSLNSGKRRIVPSNKRLFALYAIQILTIETLNNKEHTVTLYYVQYRAGQTRMIFRFRVFAHPTQRHFADAMGEDATVTKKTQTRMTRGVTGAKFRVCQRLKSK